MTANNPGPFTFHGTNSYIVGRDRLAVIDPGPDDDAHLAALIAAIGGRPVSHIFVSHTHRDHSPLAGQAQGAAPAPRSTRKGRTARRGRCGSARSTRSMPAPTRDFVPDIALADDDVIDGGDWRLRTLLTPGHAANHAAFALEGTGILFSGDHVMAWSTSIVAPPDGAMADYMASLDKLLDGSDSVFLPGHGGPVKQPRNFMRGLKAHRKMRERAILERLAAGDRTIPDMVAQIYRDTDPRLHGAAALSVLAHLEDLVARGLVEADGDPSIDAAYALRAGQTSFR